MILNASGTRVFYIMYYTRNAFKKARKMTTDNKGILTGNYKISTDWYNVPIKIYIAAAILTSGCTATLKTEHTITIKKNNHGRQ